MIFPIFFFLELPNSRVSFLHNFSRKIIIITNPFCFSVRSQRDTPQRNDRQNEIIIVCMLKFKTPLQLYQLNVCNICDNMP